MSETATPADAGLARQGGKGDTSATPDADERKAETDRRAAFDPKAATDRGAEAEGREKFDRQKVLGGLLKASEKRPISVSRLSELVNQVEARVMDSADREITTAAIGEYLMNSLKEFDKIAYVRFASVYRNFQDEEAFFNELKNLMRQKVP